MQVNYKKTKMILFNTRTAYDFEPRFTVKGNEIETVEQVKLLGVVLRNDLSWSSNTDYLVDRTNKKLWMLRRLKNLGADVPELVDVYEKQVWPVLEMAVPV